jgi:hypothetical protein
MPKKYLQGFAADRGTMARMAKARGVEPTKSK